MKSENGKAFLKMGVIYKSGSKDTEMKCKGKDITVLN
jgi:hypothetical protein